MSDSEEDRKAKDARQVALQVRGIKIGGAIGIAIVIIVTIVAVALAHKQQKENPPSLSPVDQATLDKMEKALKYTGTFSYPGPRVVYCGTKGCSINSDDVTIGRTKLSNTGYPASGLAWKQPTPSPIDGKHSSKYHYLKDGTGDNVAMRWVKSIGY